MSKMRPIIVLWKDGVEKWYPSMADVVKERGISRETLRQIIEYGRFGNRNRQNIEMAWWSDFDRNKLTIGGDANGENKIFSENEC